jgi:hypothetical protein
MIDTGISDYYHSVLSYLDIKGENFHLRVWRKGEYAEEEAIEPTSIDQQDEKREDVEYYLKNAAVVRQRKEAVPGRTAAAKVDLDDGVVKRRAMFKTVDIRRPDRLPDSYKYELAAYALDKLLDFDRIPAALEREIEGTKGSLQILVENCFGLDAQQRKNLSPPDPQSFANALDEINVFENLTYNERNELDDILIHEDSWRIYRVDFSEAFLPTSNLIPEQKITRCSKKLYQNLRNLSDEVIESILETYLNEEEIATLINRKDEIVKTLEKLIKEKGEEAVLF